MAVLKYRNWVVKDIKDVWITCGGKYNSVLMFEYRTKDGDTCKVSFPFPKHFRVEIKGFVLEIVGTDIVVYGSIRDAQAANSIGIKGRVLQNIKSINNIVQESYEASIIGSARQDSNTARATVLHIDGDIESVNCNVECWINIHGNCFSVKSYNCIEATGDIVNAIAERAIHMSFWRVTTPQELDSIFGGYNIYT